jgi:hypothetical protein
MKTEFIQKLLLMLLTWLIQYLDGYHIRKNGGKKKVDVESMNTDEKVVLR